MKRLSSITFAILFLALLLAPRAEAVDVYLDDLTLSSNCAGETEPQNFFWEATWNDELYYPDDPVPHNETFYKVEAPCKVYYGDTFEIRITVTDDNCTGDIYSGTVAGEWSLFDQLKSSPPVNTKVDSGSYWSNDINVYPSGTWQKTYQRPTPSADNHNIKFTATDLGKCGGGHSWTSFASKDVVVDPVRPSPNTAPEASAGPDVAIGDNGEQDTTVLAGTATDVDGDQLLYRWLLSGAEVMAWSGVGAGGTAPLDLSTLVPLAIGTHAFTLEVTDSTETVSDDTVVTVSDKTPPTLAPTATPPIFWPPNNKMIDVVIDANASDNTGGTVALSISVASTQSSGLENDYQFGYIDEATGTIYLQLRSEREGKDQGRTYTVTVAGTDENGNSASAVVELLVPHDESYLDN